MNTTDITEKIFKLSRERKPQIYDLLFEFDYFLSVKLKISSGFSTSTFKPMIWLHYKKKYFIGINRDEWLYLMENKQYVKAMLNQYDYLYSTNLIKGGRDIEYTFKYRNDGCFLVISQGENKIKIDLESWKSLMKIEVFLTTILCWNTILQKQIQHFYFNYYIPSCSELRKTNIHMHEIKGAYDKDIEVDLTRLCYEFTTKMPKKIKLDLKIYQLLQRTDNK